MYRIISNAIILLLALNNLQSQNLTITINESVFKDIDKSIVLLTNEDGIIKDELILDSAQIISDVIFSSSIASPNERYDLTIFNEYTLKEVNIGAQYFSARTYYNIKNGEVIKDFIEVAEQYEIPELKSATINIKGPQKLNSVEFYTDSDDDFERTKLKKENLRIKYDHQVGTDFCATLFCNDLLSPKTIYIPEHKLKTVMNYDWDLLNNDVSLINLKLPFKEKWIVEVSAMNEETENECLFFKTNTTDFIDNLSFYYPENITFYDFQINLGAKLLNENNQTPRYIYYDISSDLFQVNDILIPDFYYDINFIDQKGFDIVLENDYDGFFISYGTLSYKPFQTKYCQGAMVQSIWEVISDSNGQLDFKFPDLSHLKNNFQTIETLNYLMPRTIGLRDKTDDRLIQIVDYREDGAMMEIEQNRFKTLGLNHLKNFEIIEAIQAFSLVLEFNPDDPEIYFHLACCHSINENAAMAFESLRKAKEKNFNDTEAILNNELLAYLRSQEAFDYFMKKNFYY